MASGRSRRTVPVTPPKPSAPGNPNLGRQWVSVTPVAPKKNYTPIPQDQINEQVRQLPDIPGVPKDHPGNAHLTGLEWMQIDWAHKNGTRFSGSHVNEQGNKCCQVQRKSRRV